MLAHRVQRLRSPSHAQLRRFTVLALESSADDSCAAVVTSDRNVLSNVVVSQQAFLEQYGGIHPFVAIHAHQRNLPGAVQRALREAKLSIQDVDGIAFTRGPGIPGCLSVCGNAARTLAASLNKPLVGVHHMQAHALTPFLTSPPDSRPQFPFITLLVSGGHTMFVLATSPLHFRIIAETVDESIGNAYDKVARLLDIPLDGRSGGAALERFCASPDPDPAAEGEVPELKLPIAMRGRLALSYTGIHSAVERYLDARRGTLDAGARLGIARSFQKAAVGQLEEKLGLALQQCRQQDHHVRHLVVSGGVASNAYLKERLRACLERESGDRPIELVFPPPALCTDNAVMIAWASMDRFLAGDTDDYSVESRPKWSLEELREPGMVYVRKVRPSAAT
ncbi:glycoprotease [Lenzites betulinus]|nr:glycoprotease [Lenzites betulinus]